MNKHTLKADGAAFSATTLTRVNPDSTAGSGVAICGCGEHSELLETRAARKLWFAEHKASEAATFEEFTEALAEGEEPAPAPSRKFAFEEMKVKIRKLLDKAEGTDNELERDAFMAKAQKLMVQLGIEAAELEASGTVDADQIVEVAVEYHRTYSRVMMIFIQQIAAGYGDLTILQSRAGTTSTAYVIGHKTDVELFLELMTSLEIQAMAALVRWQATEPTRKGQTNSEKFIGNRNFLYAYAERVGERLLAARLEGQQEATPGAALVLASKSERVEAWKAEQYPDLKKVVHRAQRGSAAGKAAGRYAGQQVNLGEKQVSGNRAALR